MDRDKTIEQINLDVAAGFKNAATATAEAGRQDSEEYKLTSQNTIHMLNRALGHAVHLFLEGKKITPDESQNGQIHQLRKSRHCPLDQSQINTLFDTNRLRNDLEHHRPPPDVELWQVQRAASTIYTVLPLLIPEVPWLDAWADAWRAYNKWLGGSGLRASEPHNLPRPDYAEFVGRESERNQLLEELGHPRRYLISIDGIGGVGKSALATKVAWEIADQIKQGVSPWKYVVWVSAKEDRLPPTATGIKSIKAGFHVLEDLFDQILLVSGFPEYVEEGIDSKQEAVDMILESAPCLLFIDNFETVEDPSVLAFLDDLPGASKAILTSRHREIVRNSIRLKGLAPWEAKKLIRQTAKEFGVREHFRGQEIIDRIMRDTGNIPLALRWVVGQVSLGRTVGDVLTKMGQRTEEIHRFCFDATVNELDELHLETLYVLSQLRDPADAETIASISGFALEEVKDILLTLMRYSLVSRMIEPIWQTDLYHLLPLTVTYCAGLGSRWPEYARDVAKRSKTESQRQRTIAVANGLYKRYGAYDDNERVAVAAANAAREEHVRGNSEKALEILGEAMALAPNLGHIHHVNAQLLADMEQFQDARDSFQKAYQLDPRAEVLRSWAELEFSTGQYALAMDLLEQSCELRPEDVGLRLLLAQATTRHAELTRSKGNKQQANKLSSAALRHAESALVEHATTTTQMQHNVKCYDIMMEIYQERGNAKRALEICGKALEINPGSFRLRSLADALESSAAGTR